MNKTDPILKSYFISYFRYADNIKAVEGFTENFQKSLDEYYLSICGTDRQKMHQKCLELEKFVSDEYILCSTHVFNGTAYTAFPEHIVLGEEIVKYFSLFNLGEKLCIALPRGIVEIANPKLVQIKNILVCRIPNYPDRERNKSPFAVYDEIVLNYNIELYPPVFNESTAYYEPPVNRTGRKSWTVIVQATENSSYAVYNKICYNVQVKECPRIKLEDSTAYDWAVVSGQPGTSHQCKSGRKFRDGAWTQP